MDGLAIDRLCKGRFLGSHGPTCGESEIDFYCLRETLLPRVKHIFANDDTVVRPHVPVMLELEGQGKHNKVVQKVPVPRLPSTPLVGPLQQWKSSVHDNTEGEGPADRWGKWARQVMVYLHDSWPEMGKATKASLTRGEGPKYRVMASKDALASQSYKDASECTRGWMQFQVQLKAAQRDKRLLPDKAWKRSHEVVTDFQVEWQLKRNQRKDYARRKAGWKKFCQECLLNGGKDGYNFLKKKREIYAQAVTEGGMPVGGSEGMTQLAKPWLKLWEVHKQVQAEVYTTGDPLPELSREDFERAVVSAPLRAAGYDAMPVAMLKCLPADAVTELWQMVTDWEFDGVPASQWVNVFALLPKTETQTRPIALTAMALRIWARARSIKHQGAFQEVNTQLHGGTAELQCETLAAQHCLSSEAAQGLDGYETIQIYLDLTKAYEYVSHKVMVGEASKESQLLGRLAIQCARSYAVQRAITFNGLATKPTHIWLDPSGLCHGHTLHEAGAQTTATKGRGWFGPCLHWQCSRRCLSADFWTSEGGDSTSHLRA
eukprot:1791394-Amphidinium_carterae.1